MLRVRRSSPGSAPTGVQPVSLLASTDSDSEGHQLEDCRYGSGRSSSVRRVLALSSARFPPQARLGSDDAGTTAPCRGYRRFDVVLITNEGREIVLQRPGTLGQARP